MSETKTNTDLFAFTEALKDADFDASYANVPTYTPAPLGTHHGIIQRAMIRGAAPMLTENYVPDPDETKYKLLLDGNTWYVCKVIPGPKGQKDLLEPVDDCEFTADEAEDSNYDIHAAKEDAIEAMDELSPTSLKSRGKVRFSICIRPAYGNIQKRWTDEWLNITMPWERIYLTGGGELIKWRGGLQILKDTLERMEVKRPAHELTKIADEMANVGVEYRVYETANKQGGKPWRNVRINRLLDAGEVAAVALTLDPDSERENRPANIDS